MGEIILRNLDDLLVTRLKQRAEHDGPSVEEVAERMLADALQLPKGEAPQPSKAELLAEMDRIAAMSPGPQTSSFIPSRTSRLILPAWESRSRRTGAGGAAATWLSSGSGS